MAGCPGNKNVTDLGDRWPRMLKRQWELQVDTFEHDPMLVAGRDQFVIWNHTALIKELGEALDEVAWKPWADDSFFNREAFIKELVDAFHFWMNLLLVARKVDQSVEDLAFEFFTAYMKKAKINQERQEQPGGYHVLGTKCPDCGRAIEDGASLPDEGEGPSTRCLCGRRNYLATATS